MNYEKLFADVRQVQAQRQLSYSDMALELDTDWGNVVAIMKGIATKTNPDLTNRLLQFVGNPVSDYLEPKPTTDLSKADCQVEAEYTIGKIRLNITQPNSQASYFLTLKQAGEVALAINTIIIEQEFIRLNIPELPQGESLELIPREESE